MDYEKEQEMLGKLNAMWDSASVLMEQQLNQFAINEALVNNRHITRRKPGRSSIFVPKLAGYLRRKLADFVGQFTGDEPVSVSETLTSSAIGAKIYQKVHNHYLSRMPVPYSATIYNGAYCGLVYNFAPAFISVEKEEVEEEVVQQVAAPDGSFVTNKEKVRRVADIKLRAEALPPENVRIDPSVAWDNIDEARFISYIEYISEDEAEEKVRTGEWKKVNIDDYRVAPSSKSNVLAVERRSQASPFSSAFIDSESGLIEVRHHFFWDEYEGEYRQLHAVTIGDAEIVVDPEPLDIDWGDGVNPAWPFVVGLVYPKPFEMHAPAMPEQGKDLQIEVNAIRNQRRDNVALILNPEKYVSQHAGVDPEQLALSYPGKVVTVSNLGAIQWQTVPDVTSAGHNEETRVENDMDRLFSEGPLRAGVEGRRKESATAIQMMTSNASAATGLDTDLFRITFVEPLNRKLMAAIKQTAPDEVFIAAASDLMVSDKTDPVYEATNGQFDINVFASSAQAEFAAKLSNISNVIGMIQTTYGPNANYKPLVDQVVELLGLDPDAIIPDPVEQQLPNQAALDMGGVMPQGTPSIMPRAQFLGGGGMPEGSGNQ